MPPPNKKKILVVETLDFDDSPPIIPVIQLREYIHVYLHVVLSYTIKHGEELLKDEKCVRISSLSIYLARYSDRVDVLSGVSSWWMTPTRKRDRRRFGSIPGALVRRRFFLSLSTLFPAC